jgi:hypothetical protein
VRLLLLSLLLVAGCGTGDDAVSTQPAAPATSLVVEHVPDEGAEPQRWTLTCDPVGGDHPQAVAACRALDAQQDPFAPVPADAICTEQYGGPQTATVRGTYRGQPVDLELSRVNGCYISQWDRLVPLVPGGS